MAYGDPVLQRSMFRSPSVQPSVGLGSGTSADENAQALRNMFSPTVSINEPAAMIQQEQQPVQSFQTGGEAITPAEAARRQAIDDVDALRAPAAPTSQFYRDIEPFLPSMPTESRVMENAAALRRLTDARRNALEQQQRVLQEYRTAAPGSSVGDYFRAMSPEERAARSTARTAAAERVSREGPVIGQTFAREAGVASLLPAPPAPPTAPTAPSGPAGTPLSAGDRSRMLDADRLAESGAYMGRPAPAPAPERERGGIELTLEGIRADRARKAAEQAAAERMQRTASERRENALLALMQAGFAAAAGRSPNALSNIAAGGQAGVAAFAGMEKDRRADEAARRREETTIMLERERLRAQEERAPEAIRTYAMLGGWNPAAGTEGFNDAVRRGIEVTKSLEKEPDNIRLFKALGNGNLARGFEVYNSDNALKAANTTVNNLQASDEDRRTAQNYINIRIRQAQQAVSGSGQAPPAGSTVIPFNQLPVR